jgi:hypothetical protein
MSVLPHTQQQKAITPRRQHQDIPMSAEVGVNSTNVSSSTPRPSHVPITPYLNAPQQLRGSSKQNNPILGEVLVAAAGGGGGEYARGVFSAATISTSQTVTIGAGGTAGAS